VNNNILLCIIIIVICYIILLLLLLLYRLVALFTRFPSAASGGGGAQKTSGAKRNSIFCTCFCACIYIYYNIYMYYVYTWVSVHTRNPFDLQKWGCAFVYVCAWSLINTLRVRFCPEGVTARFHFFSLLSSLFIREATLLYNITIIRLRRSRYHTYNIHHCDDGHKYTWW